MQQTPAKASKIENQGYPHRIDPKKKTSRWQAVQWRPADLGGCCWVCCSRSLGYHVSGGTRDGEDRVDFMPQVTWNTSRFTARIEGWQKHTLLLWCVLSWGLEQIHQEYVGVDTGLSEFDIIWHSNWKCKGLVDDQSPENHNLWYVIHKTSKHFWHVWHWSKWIWQDQFLQLLQERPAQERSVGEQEKIERLLITSGSRDRCSCLCSHTTQLSLPTPITINHQHRSFVLSKMTRQLQ